MPNLEGFQESMGAVNRLGDLFKQTLEPMLPEGTAGERALMGNLIAALGMGGTAGMSAMSPQLWAMLMGTGGPMADKISKTPFGMAKNPNVAGFSPKIGWGSSRLPMEAGIVDISKMKSFVDATNKAFIQSRRASERMGAGRWSDAMFAPR